MQIIVVALVTVGAIVALRGPLKAAFAVVVAGYLFTPGTLSVPGVTHEAVIARVLLYAFAVGLVLRSARGELAPNAFRFSRVHVALLIFVAVALFNGVALAGADVPLKASVSQWLRILDQLVLLVAATAAVRSLDRAWVIKLLAVLATATAGIAILEHLTGGSWGHWLFSHLPGQSGRPGSFPLDGRGGELRVRGAAQFALEFGWVSAILVPLVVAVAATSRRRLALLAPAAVVVAIVFSWSRSSVLGLVLGAGAVLVLSRANRRLTGAIVGGIAVAAVVLLAAPSLRDPFDAAKQTDAITIRTDRLPAILDVAAERPATGLGLGGLATRGFLTTDISYLLVYAQLGMIGLVTFVAAIAIAIATALKGLRGRDGPERALAAAVATGLLLVPVAAGAYDLSSVAQSTAVLWLLAAVAVSLAETAPATATVTGTAPVRWRPVRLALPVAGAAIGVAVLALMPSHATATYRFTTLSDVKLAKANSDSRWAGQVLVRSTCVIVDGMRISNAHVECRQRTFDKGPQAPGMGELRVEARSPQDAQAAAALVVRRVRGALPATEFDQVGPVETGRPAPVRVAPFWLGWAGLLVALLVPAVRLRPRAWAARAGLVPAPA